MSADRETREATVSRPQPPPDAPWPEPPEGYRAEWRADSLWRTAGELEAVTRHCRRPGCTHRPVAALKRSSSRHSAWWLYCADHLYGRRIVNGRVETRRLIRLTEEET